MLSLGYPVGTYNSIDRPCIFNGDPSRWTPLQIEVIMAVANAKIDEFAGASHYVARLVRHGLVAKQDGVDTLHEAAAYNALYGEYGRDEIQSIIAAAFKWEAGR
jgi:hypothetical protein